MPEKDRASRGDHAEGSAADAGSSGAEEGHHPLEEESYSENR